MSIEAVQIPRRQRARKHSFTEEDADKAAEILEQGGNPGRAGYETQGTARAAATTLAAMVGENIGTSTFQTDDGTWAFALRVGKKKMPSKKGKK